MFVLRVIAEYKAGKLNDAARVIAKEITRIVEKSGYGELRSSRLLIPTEQENTIIGEYEFDNLENNERFWESWHADPESAEFMQNHTALLADEPQRERLEVINFEDYQE